MDASIGFLISQTYRKITQLLTLRLREYDITPEQFSVLFRVCEYDGLNQKELSLRAAKDQPTTARILEALGKKDLIEKQMSPSDRRAFLVFATDKGKALVELTAPIEAQVIADAVQGIDPVHLDLFTQCLSQIRQNVEKHEKE
ncbi:MarR family transcriptional regulator [Tumebacillus sp. ITR2]|uniref:MarR family transcriptional regulator n=1 Tax=Tumebacillus amylolyticus TaxID=2801339 RepID=A0ABS1J681_9BACL|nr:MarR family transcriptional regulator [Tumebacillus amylolyticus]MBL0385787.1 MarR family transcriptional regulator [Tumebacillus amylolyticus]